MPTFTGVSHVDLTVTDAERSAAWYKQVLGLDQLHSTDSPDTFEGRMINLVHPSTSLIVSVIKHEKAEPGAFSEFRVGLDHLAFTVGARADLDSWVEHFDSLGVNHSGINDMGYGSVLVFRDPDGIQLELFCFTPAGAATVSEVSG